MRLQPPALLLVAAISIGCSRRDPPNAALVTPVFALQELKKAKADGGLKSLYWNPGALGWVQSEELFGLSPEDRSGTSLRMRGFSQAAQDPPVFRRLDREQRIDLVWLLGDPSGFKPLLEHFLETKDFTLAWLDHTSLIFRRGGTWDSAELDKLRGRFSSASDQATFLAGAAAKLVAVHQSDAARHRLQEAEKLDANLPGVWSGWATYHLARGDLSAALTAADRALSRDQNFIPAIACKTQVLFGTKRFVEAFQLSKKLLDGSPDEPGLLFYHAKLAHQVHAYDDEIAALARLIELAQAAGASVSGYRVYLGQAYAAKGEADPALDQLSLALLDTELPREQRAFADQLFLQIKDRVGLPGDPKK